MLSCERFAHTIICCCAKVSSVDSGMHVPALDCLLQLCERLGCSVEVSAAAVLECLQLPCWSVCRCRAGVSAAAVLECLPLLRWSVCRCCVEVSAAAVLKYLLLLR